MNEIKTFIESYVNSDCVFSSSSKQLHILDFKWLKNKKWNLCMFLKHQLYLERVF